MTKTWKDRMINWVSTVVLGAIVAALTVSLTSSSEESRELKKTIEKKADVTYVDQKCLEVKNDAKVDKAEILMRLGELQQQNTQLFQQNSEIYQAIIQMKK